MYENGATLKQPTGAILHPGAGASSGLIFHTATSAAAAAAAAGQFVTMVTVSVACNHCDCVNRASVC